MSRCRAAYERGSPPPRIPPRQGGFLHCKADRARASCRASTSVRGSALKPCRAHGGRADLRVGAQHTDLAGGSVVEAASLQLGHPLLGVAVAEAVGTMGPAERPAGGLPEGLAPGVAAAEVVALAVDDPAVANCETLTTPAFLETGCEFSGNEHLAAEAALARHDVALPLPSDEAVRTPPAVSRGYRLAGAPERRSVSSSWARSPARQAISVARALCRSWQARTARTCSGV